MKKFLLLLSFCSFSLLGAAQYISTIQPIYGCPNKNNTITVTVQNGYTAFAPGVSYTVTIVVKSSGGTDLKTFTETNTDGWGAGQTKNFEIVDIPFTIAETCTIPVNIVVPSLSYNSSYGSNTYIVQYVPTIGLSVSSGTINPSGSYGYAIEYYNTTNMGTPIYNATSGQSYTPTEDGQYQARAYEPVNGCYAGYYSNIVTITIASVSEAKDLNVSVYPNPIASIVTIETGSSSVYSYEISDLNGEVIRKGTVQGTGNINLAEVTSGAYLLVVKNNEGKFSSYKLVK